VLARGMASQQQVQHWLHGVARRRAQPPQGWPLPKIRKTASPGACACLWEPLAQVFIRGFQEVWGGERLRPDSRSERQFKPGLADATAKGSNADICPHPLRLKSPLIPTNQPLPDSDRAPQAISGPSKHNTLPPTRTCPLTGRQRRTEHRQAEARRRKQPASGAHTDATGFCRPCANGAHTMAARHSTAGTPHRALGQWCDRLPINTGNAPPAMAWARL